jgi:hypothetical protein
VDFAIVTFRCWVLGCLEDRVFGMSWGALTLVTLDFLRAFGGRAVG